MPTTADEAGASPATSSATLGSPVGGAASDGGVQRWEWLGVSREIDPDLVLPDLTDTEALVGGIFG